MHICVCYDMSPMNPLVLVLELVSSGRASDGPVGASEVPEQRTLQRLHPGHH